MKNLNQKVTKTKAALLFLSVVTGLLWAQFTQTPLARAQLTFPGDDDPPGGGATNNPPDGVITSPASNITIQAGDTVDFSGVATDPDNHTPINEIWIKNSSGQQSQVIEELENVFFGVPGTYTIIYQVADSQGLADPTPDNRTIQVTQSSPADSTPPAAIVDLGGYSIS